MESGDLGEFENIGYPRAAVAPGVFRAAREAIEQYRRETGDGPPLLHAAPECNPGRVAVLRIRAVQIAYAQHQPIHVAGLGHRCTNELPRGFARCPYMHRGRPNAIFGMHCCCPRSLPRCDEEDMRACYRCDITGQTCSHCLGPPRLRRAWICPPEQPSVNGV